MTDYIGGVAAMVVIEFVGILAFCYFYYFKKYPPVYSETAYQDCGQSVWNSKYPNANTWLLCWRLFCFAWFFWFAIVAKWISVVTVEKKDPGYWFFTNWNLILLGVYFGLAAVCSLQFRKDPTGVAYDSPLQQKLPAVVGAMHDVAGANAIFVTVVALGILDPSPNFWNLTNHLSNTLFIFVEMSLNSIKACSHNYVWSIIWAFVYVSFAWVIVYTKTREVPYFFLNTVNKPASFGWYTGLIVINGVFFVGWIYLNKWLKLKVEDYALDCARGQLSNETGLEMVEKGPGAKASATAEQRLCAPTGGRDEEAPAARL